MRREILSKSKFHLYGNFDHNHIQCYGEVARSSLNDNFMRSTQVISEYNNTYLHYSILDWHKWKKSNSIKKLFFWLVFVPKFCSCKNKISSKTFSCVAHFMRHISQAVNSSNVFVASGWTVCWHDSYRATTDDSQRNRKLFICRTGSEIHKQVLSTQDGWINLLSHQET